MSRNTDETGRALRWDAQAGRWCWSSSTSDALQFYLPGAGVIRSCRLPDSVGILAHCRSGRLIVGLRKGLYLAEIPDLAFRRRIVRLWALTAVDAAEPRTWMSDGRIDGKGYLVFGTGNSGSDARPIGSYFQYSQRHGLRRLALPAVTRASSIAFSADGTRLFFADANAGRILECAYDAKSATVERITLFATVAPGRQTRGAVVDREGCLWSAQIDPAGLGHHKLVQYDVHGKMMREVHSAGSCPAFGGEGLKQLMVAGSAGPVHLEDMGAAGFAEPLFDDRDSDFGGPQPHEALW